MTSNTSIILVGVKSTIYWNEEIQSHNFQSLIYRSSFYNYMKVSIIPSKVRYIPIFGISYYYQVTSYWKEVVSKLQNKKIWGGENVHIRGIGPILPTNSSERNRKQVVIKTKQNRHIFPKLRKKFWTFNLKASLVGPYRDNSYATSSEQN